MQKSFLVGLELLKKLLKKFNDNLKIIIKNKLAIFSYLTLYRIFNYLLVCLGFLWSLVIKKTKVIGLPYALSFEPSNLCNLKCLQCPSGNGTLTRSKGIANFNDFKQIIDEVSKYVFYLNLYFQGEPFMNPLLSEMIDYANHKKIYTVVSTNGHFINQDIAYKIIKSGLSKIIISVDGITQDVYQTYRVNGNVNKVIDGIKIIANAKKELRKNNPLIVLQCLVFSSNENQLLEIKQLGKNIGVDEITIKTAQIYDFSNGNKLIPDNKKYSRYIQLASGEWVIKSNKPNRCFLLWSSSVITWDGFVVPCCFDKNANYVSGNLKSNTFTKIWYSEKANDFRKKVLTNRRNIDICSNCTQGLNKL